MDISTLENSFILMAKYILFFVTIISFFKQIFTSEAKNGNEWK